MLYPKIVETVWRFIAGNDQNYNRLRNNLCLFKEIFQYIYLMVHPEIFKACKDKKKFQQLVKDPNGFFKDRNKQFKFEQKSIETDNFNTAEENRLVKKLRKEKRKTRDSRKK